MGRGKTYTIKDYADRILLFMYAEVDSVTTQQIMEGVKGTHYRLVDGLMLLGMLGKVTMKKTEHNFHWSVKQKNETPQIRTKQ